MYKNIPRVYRQIYFILVWSVECIYYTMDIYCTESILIHFRNTLSPLQPKYVLKGLLLSRCQFVHNVKQIITNKHNNLTLIVIGKYFS